MSLFGKFKMEKSPGGTRVSLKILVGKRGVKAPQSLTGQLTVACFTLSNHSNLVTMSTTSILSLKTEGKSFTWRQKSWKHFYLVKFGCFASVLLLYILLQIQSLRKTALLSYIQVLLRQEDAKPPGHKRGSKGRRMRYFYSL